MANFIGISSAPVIARACKTPIDALELWSTEHIAKPIKRPSSGLSAFVIKLWNDALVLSTPIASEPLIYFRPKKRTPNPRIIWPIYLWVCFF